TRSCQGKRLSLPTVASTLPKPDGTGADKSGTSPSCHYLISGLTFRCIGAIHRALNGLVNGGGRDARTGNSRPPARDADARLRAAQTARDQARRDPGGDQLRLPVPD